MRVSQVRQIQALTLTRDFKKNQNKLVQKAEKLAIENNWMINSHTYLEVVNHPWIPFLNIAKGEFRYYDKNKR